MGSSTCHPDRPAVTRGLCSPCYRRKLASSRQPSSCHPDRPEYVVGSRSCAPCYSRAWRQDKPKSLCHPEFPEHVKGSGTCQSCYNAARKKVQADSTCHPGQPEALKGKGVCHSCYDKARRDTRARAKCHPDRPQHVKSTGLCASCALQKNRFGIVVPREGLNCEICRSLLKMGVGQSAVDHDHKTGAIRGVLCGACNKMLGFAKDNIDTLRAAIAYLESSKGRK